MIPAQCHLWQKDPTEDDLRDAFEIVKTISEDDHASRRLVRCTQCGQLYQKQFDEQIDWVGGEDPQYVTYIPVADEQDTGDGAPRLHQDWPSDGPKKLYWTR